MSKKIKWAGVSRREIHGYVFMPGQVIEVDDEEIALDILTQPGEPFVEVEPEAGEDTPQPKPKRRK